MKCIKIAFQLGFPMESINILKYIIDICNASASCWMTHYHHANWHLNTVQLILQYHNNKIKRVDNILLHLEFDKTIIFFPKICWSEPDSTPTRPNITWHESKFDSIQTNCPRTNHRPAGGRRRLKSRARRTSSTTTSGGLMIPRSMKRILSYIHPPDGCTPAVCEKDRDGAAPLSPSIPPEHLVCCRLRTDTRKLTPWIDQVCKLSCFWFTWCCPLPLFRVTLHSHALYMAVERAIYTVIIVCTFASRRVFMYLEKENCKTSISLSQQWPFPN